MSIGKILIVEDDFLSAKVLNKNVIELGYQVCAICNDYESAICEFKKHSPDIVLMDFNLGEEKDGIDLASELSKIGPSATVMITSGDSERDLDKILSNKPDAYIQKPIDIRELRAVLELASFKFQKEQEMADLNANLEIRVKERTEELDIAVKSLIKEMSSKEKIHDQLEKALKSEKQFGELKAKIISNLSHEFKTPLSSIRSSAQILEKMVERNMMHENSLKHILRIEKSAEILNELLVRILSVERDQDKLYSAELMEIDFMMFMESIEEEVKTMQGASITVDYKIELFSETLITDPKLLRLILTNLISNACKYSPESTQVDVIISSDEANMTLEVRDYGIGMDTEDVNQIFYRFFRGKNVGSIEGTGIGMSIVKRCIDALGGKIEIESEIGKGSTFRVRVPVLEVKHQSFA